MSAGNVFRTLVRIYSPSPQTEHAAAAVKFTPYRYRMHTHTTAVTSSPIQFVHQSIDQREKKKRYIVSFYSSWSRSWYICWVLFKTFKLRVISSSINSRVVVHLTPLCSAISGSVIIDATSALLWNSSARLFQNWNIIVWSSSFVNVDVIRVNVVVNENTGN